MNSGRDGIVMMGCQRGRHYQCHFVRGDIERAPRLIEEMGEAVEKVGMSPLNFQRRCVMSDTDTATIVRYRNSILGEVGANVPAGRNPPDPVNQQVETAAKRASPRHLTRHRGPR